MILISCFFMGNSPFEFAILCVIALARCPPYSGRDSYGPGPIPSETYANSFIAAGGAVLQGGAQDTVGPTSILCFTMCSNL